MVKFFFFPKLQIQKSPAGLLAKNLLDRLQVAESVAFSGLDVVALEVFVPAADHDRVAITGSVFSGDLLRISKLGREGSFVAVHQVLVRF